MGGPVLQPGGPVPGRRRDAPPGRTDARREWQPEVSVGVQDVQGLGLEALVHDEPKRDCARDPRQQCHPSPRGRDARQQRRQPADVHAERFPDKRARRNLKAPGPVLSGSPLYFEVTWTSPAASSALAPAPWNVAPTEVSPRSSRAKKAVR